MNFLGKNIRLLRKQTSKTQSELASLIGKGQTTIGNWENGISEPSLDELLLLSNYFDISLDILIKVDLSQTNWKVEKGEMPERGRSGKRWTMIMVQPCNRRWRKRVWSSGVCSRW